MRLGSKQQVDQEVSPFGKSSRPSSFLHTLDRNSQNPSYKAKMQRIISKSRVLSDIQTSHTFITSTASPASLSLLENVEPTEELPSSALGSSMLIPAEVSCRESLLSCLTSSLLVEFNLVMSTKMLFSPMVMMSLKLSLNLRISSTWLTESALFHSYAWIEGFIHNHLETNTVQWNPKWSYSLKWWGVSKMHLKSAG